MDDYSPTRSAQSPFVPLPETIAFLYSLPLPPGVASQPQPQSQQDWALVEQYRLLCQSLSVLGEYERARRAEGMEPVEWQDLKLPSPPSPNSLPPPPPPAPHSQPPPPAPSNQSIHSELSNHNAVAQLSQSLSSFPSSSFTFTSSGSLADGSLSLDLSLPLDLDSTSGPASLPSLMSAISELEHCVARLSLEANEARNLQRSLRSEMATRQTTTNGGQSGNLVNGKAGGGSGNSSAKKNGKKTAKNQESTNPPHSQGGGGNAPQSNNYDHDRYQLDLEYQHEQLQKQANEVVAAATKGNPSGSTSGGLGVKSWEDRELMKALESVSMLDKRADEYRERLKILKEQIHHHAALADALASQSSSPSNRSHGGKNGHAHNSSRFGDAVSDTGMRMVNTPRSKK
ncbi:hypothetical protein JCM16303_000144 [Sporobolomyces ruberrimus]